MSPLNWLMLMGFFIFIFMMTLLIMYFYFPHTFHSSDFLNKSLKKISSLKPKKMKGPPFKKIPYSSTYKSNLKFKSKWY